MHEHVRNIRWSWVGFGWFIAVALTSLILLALGAFGIIASDTGDDGLWTAITLTVGFFVTGFFVGTRVAAAPVLHGIAMGLFSLAAWIGVNLFFGEPTGETTWRALDVQTIAGLIVVQGVAAVMGVRIGVRWLRTPPTRS